MIEATISIKDGCIVSDNPFSTLPDGNYCIKIKPTKSKSTKQRAFYFGVVVPMVRAGLVNVGYNEIKCDHDAHLVMKHLFLSRKAVNKAGEEVIVEGTTTNISAEQFNNYLENICHWAAEYLNVIIPQPNTEPC